MRDPTDSVTSAVTPTVAATLQGWAAEPWRADWFAVMRRLECVADPAPRWGTALLPSAEPVRIGQEPSLSFAPSTISRIEPASATAPPRLRQHVFGYLGPNGPLPIHLSDFIRERAINHGDRTMLAFLDQFTHRFALHFYRAWAQARPAVSMDRPSDDRFAAQVGAFVGINGPARRGRDDVPDDARLHFSGWLARRVHNAEGIERVLQRYFDVPVQLERWVGHWLRVPVDELSRLGRGESSRTLGGGALLGRQVWDRQHRVRLHLGPLSLARYLEFLPIGAARPVLQRWMAQLTGHELEWDAQLVLCRDEVPQARLGQTSGNAPRLGWVCWLGGQPRSRDAADVRINAAAVAMEAAR